MRRLVWAFAGCTYQIVGSLMPRLIWNCPVCILNGQCISATEDCFILANSANPDEMPSYVTFDLGLHCLIKYLFTCIQNENGLLQRYFPIQISPYLSRPSVESALWKKYFLISQPKHIVGTQKNRLHKLVLLAIQNICLNRWVRKYLLFTIHVQSVQSYLHRWY